MDPETNVEMNPELPRVSGASHQMDPESQRVSEASSQMDPESCVQMIGEVFAEMDTEKFEKWISEICAQMGPEALVQMTSKVWSQMDPEICAPMTGEVCARLNPQDCAQKISDAYAKIDPEARAQIMKDECAKMEPQRCAQMISEAYAHVYGKGAAQIDAAASAQTDRVEEVTFRRACTRSTYINRAMRATIPYVVERIKESRDRYDNNRRLRVVRNNRCPLYVFAADLVQYVMRCYYGSNYRQAFEFTGEYAHSSPVTRLSTEMTDVLRRVFYDRQVVMHVTYLCFALAGRNESKLKDRMLELRSMVEKGFIRTYVDLINFCFIVAHFSTVAYYYDEIALAPYMALDTMYWNMVQFVRIISDSDLDYFWLMMPYACKAMALQEQEMSLLHFLLLWMLDPSKMPTE